MTKIINTFKYYAIAPTHSYTMSFREGDGSTPEVRTSILANRIRELTHELIDGTWWCGNDVTTAPPHLQQLYDQHLTTHSVIEFGPNRTHKTVKSTGEVFTPLPLVDEILSKLPEEVWAPDKTFLEPSCGDGNFLVRIIAWKIWKGSTAKQALESTFAVDFMEDNVEHAKQRTLTAAFAAMVVKENGTTTVLPFLKLKDELAIGRGTWDDIAPVTHDEFCTEHYPIVEKNIVYHDALTYDYSFGEPDEIS